MRDFDGMKLARVIDACGGIDGRVKLQKVVYLLRVIGFDLPFDDFVIRQHGPFSRAVACSTDTLKSAGFVVEKVEGLPIINNSGEQAQQYSYRVSESVQALVRKHFDVTAPPPKPKIDEAAAALRSNERAVLEVAATKLFLEREEGLSGEELDTELRQLKGHLAAHFARGDALIAELQQKAWL